VAITDVEGKARALYDARRNRAAIAPFTDDDPTLGMADGYAVQSELVKLILADGDRIIGYKAGLTSKPMQTMLAVDQPDYGPVLASTVYRDGDEVSVSRFIQPKIEAEIVLTMGAELRGPGATVEGAAAAMEIVDSRFENWRIKLADTVADMASNGAVALSETVVPLAELDVRLIGMVLSRNGALVDTGVGAAALGNPLAVVAWLANTLAADGIALEPGHLVMTGALHAALPMQPGEEYLAEFDRLGSIRVQVVD
jgi:2-keto-4-pentenoate hydratase